ncbi:hypothetical protein Acr_10g0004180 [Actinidia rufa]|uniref:Uncharacterized protein n=1 Tax=Actinidia rufa TaxID=165716 RepID=A0A7J0F8U9_9ERIC|nr:hypothetical protein Acr_10g0004180 [Actinidia rufa]
MSCDEFMCMYSFSPLPDSRRLYFKARLDKNHFRGSPSNVKGWKKRLFFTSRDECNVVADQPGYSYQKGRGEEDRILMKVESLRHLKVIYFAQRRDGIGDPYDDAALGEALGELNSAGDILA